MANKIVLKKSSTASKVPLASDLDVGEIAVNLADQKLYSKNASGTVILVGSGISGAGDVVGPASATDNAIARFDTTTGKLIQNSVVTVDDSGNVVGVNSITDPDYVTFNTSPATIPTASGSMYWDAGNQTPSIVINANTSLQLGQENVALVYNGTGSTIAKGSVVAVSGAQGQRPSVVLADADSEALSAPTLGIAAEAIANGAEGFICTFGLVRGIDTSAFTAGQPIYLSSTAGAFTATKPVAPQHIVALGWVIKVNASSGEIFVNINNGWELDELHNVLITSAASGNTLIYDATAGVWKNANLTAGTGVSVTGGAGSITIANTGVTSIAGTTNQITASASTGGVTLSLPATINVNTTGTASNVTGTVAIANGGTNATDAATARSNLGLAIGTNVQAYDADLAAIAALTPTADNFIVGNGTTWTLETPAQARTSLGATTVGSNLLTLTNPSAITFPRVNADNTVSMLDAATFRTAIGAGTGNGTVTSVTGTSPVASSGGATPAISLASGYGDTQNPYASKTANFFLAAPNGTAGAPTFRAIVAADIPTLNQNTTGTASNVTGTVAVANGGTGATTAATARTNLGATTVGGNMFTLTNPSAVTFPRFNADNTISALDAATFRSAIGAGTSSTTGTVTSITAGTGLSGGTITTSGTIALANTAVTAGSYTNASITVDAQGRITAASSGSAGGVTSLTAGTGISVSASTGAVTVTNTGVTSVNGSTGDVTVSGAPTGAIMMWPTVSAPSGYLLCNGSAVSRSTYSALFAIVGTTFGAGDGSTTFNLPNYVDRFSVGAGSLYSAGSTGGSADAVVVSHTHTATPSLSGSPSLSASSTVTDPGHQHFLWNGESGNQGNITSSQYAQRFSGNAYYAYDISGSTTVADRGLSQSRTTGISVSTSISGSVSITGTVSVSTTGSSATNANLPPYLGMYYIIKT